MNEMIAIIDTETTWRDKIMSIGIAIADSITFELLDSRYYICTEGKRSGGMFSQSLYVKDIVPELEAALDEIINASIAFLEEKNISSIFAYNALFDYQHLPELQKYKWYDIMRIAAYRQYNQRISARAECYKTGRLKRGYGVENIYRMLSKDRRYTETHNALYDAVDELMIMKMLGHDITVYEEARLIPKKR